MSARRFLHTYVTAPSLILLAGASGLVAVLRSLNADLSPVGFGMGILAVAIAVGFLWAFFAWRSARSGSPSRPSTLGAMATCIGAVAIWGVGLGGVLLLVDRPAFVSALHQMQYQFSNVLQAKKETESARTLHDFIVAKEELQSASQKCESAFDELERTGPRYRLACLIFVIGFIASLISAVLVPLTCWRRVDDIQVAQLAT